MINNQGNYCDKWQGGNWETKSGESTAEGHIRQGLHGRRCDLKKDSELTLKGAEGGGFWPRVNNTEVGEGLAVLETRRES